MDAGDWVAVREHRGRFKVLRLPSETVDGSVLCYGPVNTQRARMRSFMPDQITRVEKPKARK